MIPTKQKPIRRRRTRMDKHPIRLTSLLYLREALSREAYEECEQIIQIAKEFGASELEIGYLLEDPRRYPLS